MFVNGNLMTTCHTSDKKIKRRKLVSIWTLNTLMSISRMYNTKSLLKVEKCLFTNKCIMINNLTELKGPLFSLRYLPTCWQENFYLLSFLHHLIPSSPQCHIHFLSVKHRTLEEELLQTAYSTTTITVQKTSYKKILY